MSIITVSIQVETDLDSADTLDEMWAVISEVDDKAFHLISVRIPGSVAIVYADPEGQDRESYTDDQDRDSYHVGPDALEEIRGEA